MDYRDKLRELGIDLKSTKPGIDQKVVCPWCIHRPNARKGPSLSIRVDDDGEGVTWQCHYPPCGEAGGFRNATGSNPRHKPKPRRAPPKPARMLPKNNPDPMLDYLRMERAISPETAGRAGLFLTMAGFPDGKEWVNLPAIAFPYRLNKEIVNHKYRSRDKRFVQDPGARRTLYGIDEARATGSDILIWVEGEMDVLSFWEAGIFNVVSLPDGACKTPDEDGPRFDAVRDEEYADWLATRKEYILAVDNDESGGILFENLRRRFGADRCSYVVWPTLVGDIVPKDANELLREAGKDALRELLDNRRACPVKGLRFADEALPGIAARMRGLLPPPVETGFDGLAGLWRIETPGLVVVTGIPSHGKSTFVMQVCDGISRRHGWRWAVMSPEHSLEGLVAKQCEIHRGLPLDGGPTQPMSEHDMVEAVDWLQDHFIYLDAAQEEDEPADVQWVIRRLRWASARYGVKGVVIDPWNELEDTRPRHMTETQYIGECIKALKRWAHAHDAVVIVVAHPTKLQKNSDGEFPIPTLYDCAGSANWFNKADAGLCVHRPKDMEYTQIIVQKIRNQPRAGQPGEAIVRYFPSSRRFYDYDLETGELGNA